MMSNRTVIRIVLIAALIVVALLVARIYTGSPEPVATDTEYVPVTAPQGADGEESEVVGAEELDTEVQSSDDLTESLENLDAVNLDYIDETVAENDAEAAQF